jgi:hypothetical protein
VFFNVQNDVHVGYFIAVSLKLLHFISHALLQGVGECNLVSGDVELHRFILSSKWVGKTIPY